MKKILFLTISVVIGVLIYNKSDEIIIPGDAIRVRIIANSNNVSDLYQKKVIKEEIKNDLYNLVSSANSSSEAKEVIKNNLDSLSKKISNKTTDYTINYGLNYFPIKTYKGVIYPEGEYESLVITLGKGLGDNWWCVLYPPLCLLEESDKTSEIQYKTLVGELLKIDNK